MGGRGAIVVNAIDWPLEGPPPSQVTFGYFTQAKVGRYDNEDTKRMVREYDPIQEMVLVLQKEEHHSSTYRIRAQPHQPRG